MTLLKTFPSYFYQRFGNFFAKKNSSSIYKKQEEEKKRKIEKCL